MTTISAIKNEIKNWWTFLVIGILLIITGLFAMRFPLSSYLSLSILFSILVFLTGINQISYALSNRKSHHGWGWSLSVGIIDLIIGIVLLLSPGITMSILPFILAFWLLLRGMFLISYSSELHGFGVPGWGWVLAGGILTIILSLFILFQPLVGMFTIIMWITFACIIAGIFNIILAFRLRRVKHVLFSKE